MNLDAKIPECHRAAAAYSVAMLLQKHVGRDKVSTWADHMRAPSVEGGVTFADLNTMVPGASAAAILQDSVGLEAFGVNIDKTAPDMTMAITVTLMRYHTGIIQRTMPVTPTEQPMITYVKEITQVYDLGDRTVQPKQAVELYFDPSLVNADLKKIVPLAANDGNPAQLVANGVIKFQEEVNLLELSIDATKYGQNKFNRTDIVADNVFVDTVYLKVATGSGQTLVEETFALALPQIVSRLTRNAQAANSSERMAVIQAQKFLTKGALMSSGVASTLLDACATTDEGVRIDLDIRPSINLMDAIAKAFGSAKISAYTNTPGGTPSVNLAALVAGATLTLVGYSLDARFSEENFRKSTAAVRNLMSTLATEIPTGKVYIYEYAMSQKPAENAGAELAQIMRIGLDDRGLRITMEAISAIYDQSQLWIKNPESFGGRNPGQQYAAGSMVRPYAFLGTMDFSSITSIRDADRSGDIKQHALTYLNAVMANIMAETALGQQLADSGDIVFKVVTDPRTLANVIGQPHIHNHLAALDKRGSRDGVEYRLVLPSGIVLECVTSTFNRVKGKLVIFPYINGDNKSPLNFATNWDYGTVVGQYTQSGDVTYNRLFGSARELPIVTCPIGAIIDVTGVDSATFIS
jgi:hypothetical protein